MSEGSKNFQQRAAEWLCRHRRSAPCRWLGQLSYLIWRAYENRNFEMASNGEEWLLRQTASVKNLQCAFDIGANVGDWSLACHRHLPDVTIHAFEIAPPVFSELQKKVSGLSKIVLNPVGLSDRSDKIKIFYRETSNYCTTAYEEHLGAAYALPGAESTAPKSLEVPVIRGDDYVREHDVKTIDMMKIDVEGMEERVLRGFEKMFLER